VVSEALLSGVPAICSEHCGTSGIVRRSGHGGVFPVDDRAALADLVEAMVARGPLPFNERQSLAAWARCIGATSGADHLLAIMDEIWEGGPPATAPWEMANSSSMDMVQA
jgi:glycosyltransferase involved in cell wall biosynthesis